MEVIEGREKESTSLLSARKPRGVTRRGLSLELEWFLAVAENR